MAITRNFMTYNNCNKMRKTNKKHTVARYLILLFIFFLIVFAIGRVGFMYYNQDISTFTTTDIFQAWWHGLRMDISTTGYLIAIPWLVCLIGLWCRDFPLRKWLRPYLILMGILVPVIILLDAVMYNFWKFKLNAVIFAYATSATEAGNSTSIWFLLSRFVFGVIAIYSVCWISIKITPVKLKQSARPILSTILMLLVGGFIFLGIRGGVHTSTMNVGQAYYSQSLFLNHAAVNPVFSLMSSIKRTKNYSEEFNYLSEEERASTFSGLFPEDTEDITENLLNTENPNLLIVFMESFGAKFIEELGGEPNVAPNISRLIPEGIWWDNYYSNSFRTDRGTVSAYSGWVSYPNTSLMRLPDKLGNIPSIAKSLQGAGYSTTYLYGGDIDVMGKKGYLVGSGYEELISDKDFTLTQANDSKWGANDSTTAVRTYLEIKDKPLDAKWHFGWQTINSHEPFEVPYHRLENKVLNAFAYTDMCVGLLIDSLKTTPQWDNLLVVIIPDHGFLYELTYEDPEFFHSPMLWLGGAIKEPRVMHTLMNQSDLPATLLSQMGIPHKNFPWSRNVLSKNYIYPFVYSTFPSGIMFADSTGVSVFDITSDKPITERPKPSPERIKRAKAILQTSYDQLDNLK